MSCHWNSYGITNSLQDLPSGASDHTPLLLNIKPHDNPPKKKFRFEIFWLKHQEIHGVVAAAWASLPSNIYTNPVKNFQEKVAIVRKELHRWARKKFCKRDTYLRRSKWILRQLDRVEELRQLNTTEFRLRIRLREHIFELARDKELRWKQRSGCSWLKAGDKNTKYFHAIANGRKNRNAMTTVQDENGVAIPEHQLPHYIKAHFTNLLGKKNQNRRPFNLAGKVGANHSQNLQSLDIQISETEVLAAINEMPMDKASEPGWFTC